MSKLIKNSKGSQGLKYSPQNYDIDSNDLAGHIKGIDDALGNQSDQPGIQDTIVTNNVVNIEAKVELDYGASFTIGSTPKENENDQYATGFVEAATANTFFCIPSPWASIGIKNEEGDTEKGIICTRILPGIIVKSNDKVGFVYGFNETDQFGSNSLVTKAFVLNEFSRQRILTTESASIVIEDNNSKIIVDNGTEDIIVIITSLGLSTDAFKCKLIRKGTGNVTLALDVDSPYTLKSKHGYKTMDVQFSEIEITRENGTNDFYLTGDLVSP